MFYLAIKCLKWKTIGFGPRNVLYVRIRLYGGQGKQKFLMYATLLLLSLLSHREQIDCGLTGNEEDQTYRLYLKANCLISWRQSKVNLKK